VRIETVLGHVEPAEGELVKVLTLDALTEHQRLAAARAHNNSALPDEGRQNFALGEATAAHCV
jgi:hypothetical protein